LIEILLQVLSTVDNIETRGKLYYNKIDKTEKEKEETQVL